MKLEKLEVEWLGLAGSGTEPVIRGQKYLKKIICVGCGLPVDISQRFDRLF
jgi:hypothetical protein